MEKLQAAFPWICLVVAAYFGVGFLFAAGFPPTGIKDHWPLLSAFGFFLLIPFVSKIDLFQLVSVGRKLDEVKKETGEAKEKVKDLQQDIRSVLTAQQSLSASIHTITATAATAKLEQHYHYEGTTPKQMELAEKALEDVEPTKIKFERDMRGRVILKSAPSVEKPVKPVIELSDEDMDEVMHGLDTDELILARTKVETEMRNIANKVNYPRTLVRNRPQLIQRLIADGHLTGAHDGLEDAVNVFFRIANAAAHGETVPHDDVKHALYLGERLITVFTEND